MRALVVNLFDWDTPPWGQSKTASFDPAAIVQQLAARFAEFEQEPGCQYLKAAEREESRSPDVASITGRRYRLNSKVYGPAYRFAFSYGGVRVRGLVKRFLLEFSELENLSAEDCESLRRHLAELSPSGSLVQEF